MTRTGQHPAIEAVGALIRSGRDRVHGDDGAAWSVVVPCLLQQLLIHLHSSTRGTGAGGGGGGAGTMPINAQAWDLLVEIRTCAYSWADLLDVDPRPYAAVDTPRSAGKPTTPPIGKLLRAVTVAAVSAGRTEVADAINRCARTWATRIEAIVEGQAEQRGIRGAACPECAATTVVDVRDPDAQPPAAGRYQVPALVVIAAHELGAEPTLVCLGCGFNVPLGGYPGVTATRARLGVFDGEPGQAA